MQRLVSVDGKVRTDSCYPAGFMDVVSIAKTNEKFRLLYDSKGRFKLHHISAEEAKYKLCKVRNFELRVKGVPHITTFDGRTISTWTLSSSPTTRCRSPWRQGRWWTTSNSTLATLSWSPMGAIEGVLESSSTVKSTRAILTSSM